MIVLELTFPAGRFHATPWGRHVNEGAIEWPPSPWRILRALVATWHLKARELPETTVRSLLGTLAAAPTYHLPRATTGHTRHYLPFNEGKNEKTTKVFDTFIQLAPGDAVFASWDVELSADERAALETLAGRIGYFGRAESLAAAQVVDGVPAASAGTHWMAAPQDDDAVTPAGMELVRLLTPVPPTEFAAWRNSFLAAAQEASPAVKTKGARRNKKPSPVAVPDDLFEALHADTGELQAAGWNQPPGGRWVAYGRREDAFTPPARPRARIQRESPTTARFAVVSKVPPRITQAVGLAGRIHDALCSHSDVGHGSAPVFTGMDATGKPMSDHRHAHVFCEANGAGDAITHVTIWAAMGFDEAACRTLRQLQRVWGHGGHDVRLVLHGLGQATDFPDCDLFGLPDRAGTSSAPSARVWRSATPFVATRHAKTYRDGRPKMAANGWQEGSAAHDLLRLLGLDPQWQGAVIRRQLDEREGPFIFGASTGASGRRLRSLQFQTRRHGGEGRRGQDHGAAFIIEFPQPVTGPVAVGYGAHFGLGLFRPVPDGEPPLQ